MVYCDPHRPTAEEERYRVSYLPLDDLLGSSDVISIHASMSEEARHLISREKIRLMKKGAILINVARGRSWTKRALTEALEDGRIWACGS